MMKNDCDNGKMYNGSNWAHQIKTIIDTCGLSHIWYNQFNTVINFNTIKCRTIDIYRQDWYSSINNSRRLETYAMFKHSFEFENYMDYIQEQKHRIS